MTQRHPRSDQRRVANALQAGVPDARVSRSHSRGLVVVASAGSPITRLGVDVEFLDAARPWPEIGSLLVPASLGIDLNPEDSCRLWTFGEAYFKAFGQLPAPKLFLLAAKSADGRHGGDLYWRSERLPDDFWLTLVWENKP